MLIRFSPMRTTVSVLPTARIKPFVGRRRGVRAYSEQRTERIEGVKAAVEPESELVEVGLQVFRAHSVVTALQPAFEVAENQVDDGQELFRDFRVSRLDNGQVFVSEPGQPGVAGRGVGDNHAAGHDCVLNEAGQRQGRAIRHNIEPNATGIASTPARLRAFLREPLLYLNCADDQRLIVNALAAAACRATDPRLVNFDMLASDAADLIAVGSHHARAQLVEDLKRRLVSTDAKLALELDGAKAGRQRCGEVGSPEPHAQRRVRALHHRSRCQRIVLATFAAAQDMRTVGEAERIASLAAPHAHKAVLPADRLHVGRASHIVREQPLELRQAARKRQVFAGENVRIGHGLALPRQRTAFVVPRFPTAHATLAGCASRFLGSFEAVAVHSVVFIGHVEKALHAAVGRSQRAFRRCERGGTDDVNAGHLGVPISGQERDKLCSRSFTIFSADRVDVELAATQFANHCVSNSLAPLDTTKELVLCRHPASLPTVKLLFDVHFNSPSLSASHPQYRDGMRGCQPDKHGMKWS